MNSSKRRLAVLTATLTLSILGIGACKKKVVPHIDMCAKVEHGKDDVVAQVPCAHEDKDGDTVDDAVDLCLNHKEVLNGVFDRDGCPDPDADLDLFVDSEDRCKNEAGTAPDGCLPSDKDGDGIADHLDECPTKAEDFDLEDDADGCPEGIDLSAQANCSESKSAVADGEKGVLVDEDCKVSDEPKR